MFRTKAQCRPLVWLNSENRTFPAFTYLRCVGHGSSWAPSVESGETVLFWKGEYNPADPETPMLCALPTREYMANVDGECDLPMRIDKSLPSDVRERGKHDRYVQYLNASVHGAFEVIVDLRELRELIGD